MNKVVNEVIDEAKWVSSDPNDELYRKFVDSRAYDYANKEVARKHPDYNIDPKEAEKATDVYMDYFDTWDDKNESDDVKKIIREKVLAGIT